MVRKGGFAESAPGHYSLSFCFFQHCSILEEQMRLGALMIECSGLAVPPKDQI
jgi:hypothetical protein